MLEYDFIITDNLEEFLTFYQKQIDKRGEKFIDKFLNEKNEYQYDFSSNTLGGMNRNLEISYDCVNALNEEIFNLNVKKIK